MKEKWKLPRLRASQNITDLTLDSQDETPNRSPKPDSFGPGLLKELPLLARLLLQAHVCVLAQELANHGRQGAFLPQELRV